VREGGGSIFWKTPDIGLASYSIISLWGGGKEEGNILQYKDFLETKNHSIDHKPEKSGRQSGREFVISKF
jgi:hypothetical protein